MARKPYQPSILDVCGEIMATALGKLGTSPSMVSLVPKEFLNNARLKHYHVGEPETVD